MERNHDDASLDIASNDYACADGTLTDVHGCTYRLSDFRNSPVVLVFDARGWDPAGPELVDAYNRVTARVGRGDARLINIASHAPWHALAFAGDDAAVALPVVTCDAPELRERFGVQLHTAVVVLDGAGRVAWRHTDDEPPPHPDALARILDMLAAHEPVAPTSTTPAVTCGWTRREFVAAALALGVVLTLPPFARRALASPGDPMANDAPESDVPVTLDVNGRRVQLRIDPRVTLLDALRDHAGLTGSKKGCDHGQCGACTVHIDGRRVLSCLTLALMAEGHTVTTIEGLAATAPASKDGMHPMQRAFIEHDGFQCGYCTPGQLMSATAMVSEPWGASDADVKEAMSGNICRCGAYPGIVAAIQQVRREHATRSDA